MLQEAAPLVPSIPDHLGTAVVAAGALGTAAFGVVEGLKAFAPVGEAGFGAALNILGGLVEPLAVAYGPTYKTILRAQYRGDQRELKRMLRQGVRVGLNRSNAAAVARHLASVDPEALTAAIVAAETATVEKQVTDTQRSVIGRYELAADARIDAALTDAQAVYGSTARWLAMGVALVIALAMSLALNVDLTIGLIVGIAAVPLAPIAKDLASGIQSAAKALKARA
jgi:hypothetical protein